MASFHHPSPTNRSSPSRRFHHDRLKRLFLISGCEATDLAHRFIETDGNRRGSSSFMSACHDWQNLKTEHPWREEQSLNAQVEHPGKNERLVLSIGGQIFETSRQTLCVDGNSMLASWVLRHLSHDNSPLWIDRDAQRFNHVLNYLRNGTICLQDVASLRAIQEEAAFYGLAGLHALCEEKIQNIEANEEALWRRRLDDLQQVLKDVLTDIDNKTSNFSRRNKDDATAMFRRRNFESREVADPVFRMDADF